MKPIASRRLKYFVVAWSFLLIGGYVLYVARAQAWFGSKVAPPPERVIRGTKSGAIYRPSVPSQEMKVLPSSKHAVLEPDIVYGNGSVTFEANPFVQAEEKRGTTQPSTRP